MFASSSESNAMLASSSESNALSAPSTQMGINTAGSSQGRFASVGEADQQDQLPSVGEAVQEDFEIMQHNWNQYRDVLADLKSGHVRHAYDQQKFWIATQFLKLFHDVVWRVYEPILKRYPRISQNRLYNCREMMEYKEFSKKQTSPLRDCSDGQTRSR